MINRLKHIRRLFGVNQTQFAESLGIKQGAISDIERGRTGFSNMLVSLICRTYNVSEQWFRTGEGQPFESSYRYKEDLSDLEKELLTKYASLNERERSSIETIIDELYQKYKGEDENGKT